MSDVTRHESSRKCGLNTFFIRYGCRTTKVGVRHSAWGVSIPSSSGMGVGRRISGCSTPKMSSQYLLHQVWVSDVKVLLFHKTHMVSQYLLHQVWVSDASHIFSGRSHLSQYLLHQVWVSDAKLPVSVQFGRVSIPSSSGMGVGPRSSAPRSLWRGLNTFFIRYGCRTLAANPSAIDDLSQYLLHQVWVSDCGSAFLWRDIKGLNTFFIRYGCRT